jgi:hypothetical protein
MLNDRRELLKSLAAATLACLAAPPVRALAANSLAKSAPAAGNPASFAALSATLTGYPAGDPSDPAKVFAAFATPARRAALTRLQSVVASAPATGLDAALRAQGLETIANDLVAAWYSGVVTQGSQQKVVLYADALMWSAMSFTKPMGVCGGVTGYWADPPA